MEVAVAKLRNNQRSPRKVRLVADIIRGKKVTDALNILQFTKKHAARELEKLLLSAVANWEAKNPDLDIDEADLFVKSITVDQGRTLKRIIPAPFGKAHRVRKRSSHITLFVTGGESDSTEEINTEEA